MRKAILGVVVAAALAGSAWWWFGREGKHGGPMPQDADAPLTFVPADTPYVFANLEPIPAADLDAWLAQSETMIGLWRTQYDSVYARLAGDEQMQTAKPWLKAIDDEFHGKTLRQSLEMLGFSLQSHSAIYGIGLAPVIRVQLADPAAFGAFVARIEAKGGSKIPTGKIGDLDYWQFADARSPLRGIVALQGNHLVLTLAPAADDAALRTLLGIDKPAQSLGDGGTLSQINAKYGYVPYASGYVDSTRLVSLFTAAPTPLETAFLAALEIQKPEIDAACRTEYAALAQVAPRLAFGYTTFEPKRSIGVSHLELRGDIAQDLMKLRAPMPGLAAAADSLLDVGVSLKLAQLPPLVSKWAGAVQSAPWKCDSLQGLNQAFADGSVQLNNPAVFAAAPVFEGLHAIATRFSMPTAGQAPDFAGKLVIGSPSPKALIAMAQSFAPQLASMNLQADGKVQPLPAMPGMPAAMPAHVAMTGTLLGIAVGTGEEATLAQAMTSNPTQQPVFVMGYAGAAFAQFFEQMQASLETLESDPAKREELRRSTQMMTQVYGLMRRIQVRVEFDENGVLVEQTVQMN